MGKYMSVIIGGVVALAGFSTLISWWPDFCLVLRGVVPAFLIFGGLIAVIAGLSEMKDELSSKKEAKK